MTQPAHTKRRRRNYEPVCTRCGATDKPLTSTQGGPADEPTIAHLCPACRATTQSPKGERPRIQPARIDRWQRQWADMRRVTNELHDAAEDLLAVGDQLAADGYAPSVRGGEGHGAGDHADPVLAHVEHYEDGPPPDVVASWLGELLDIGRDSHRQLRRGARLKDMILNRRDPRVHDIGGHCQACGRAVSGADNDRLRTGFCDSNACDKAGGGSCYRAWLTYRDNHGDATSHIGFIRHRVAELDQMFGPGSAQPRADISVA
jgi:hypothetical protein